MHRSLDNTLRSLRQDLDRRHDSATIENVRVKQDLAMRLRQVRQECFGEDGMAEVARSLHISWLTWSNYEAGVTIPGEILLGFIVLTDVVPCWLLHGEGAKFHLPSPSRPLKPVIQRLDEEREG